MTGVQPDIRPDDKAALDRLARLMTNADHDEFHYDLVGRRRHRGSINLLVDLTADDGTHRLFVKRLREHASTRYRQAAEGRDRPRLKPIPDPESRLTDEAVALRAIHKMVDDANRNEWFAVPVVPVSGCPDLLVLQRIDAPTMAEQLRRDAPASLIDRASRSLGAWLWTLHSRLPELDHAEPHLAHSADVVRLVREMIDHLGDRRLRRNRNRILEVMAALPATMEPVPSHGDLAPQNVFLTDDGRIGVFDTSVNLTMPVHFDLAYFAVMIEFAGYKQPLSRTQATSERVAEQLRVGYGSDIPPRSELIAFEIALLLDRWCSLAERNGRSSVIPVLVRRGRRELLATLLNRGIVRRLDQLGDG